MVTVRMVRTESPRHDDRDVMPEAEFTDVRKSEDVQGILTGPTGRAILSLLIRKDSLMIDLNCQ